MGVTVILMILKTRRLDEIIKEVVRRREEKRRRGGEGKSAKMVLEGFDIERSGR